jgi:hypothetical protein
MSKWKIDPEILVNEHPAMLAFRDSDCIAIYKHPVEWPEFRFTIYESWSGIFQLSYYLASVDPFSESTGELSININWHSNKE